MKVTNGVIHVEILKWIGQIYECKCGRKVLVERVLVGTDHTARIFVACWDCLSKENKERAIKQYELEKVN